MGKGKPRRRRARRSGVKLDGEQGKRKGDI